MKKEKPVPRTVTTSTDTITNHSSATPEQAQEFVDEYQQIPVIPDNKKSVSSSSPGQSLHRTGHPKDADSNR